MAKDPREIGLLEGEADEPEAGGGFFSGLNSKVKFFTGKFENLSFDNMIGDFKEQAAQKLTRKLKRVTGNTMDKMSPQCGQQAVEKACDKYPVVEKVDETISAVDMTEKATNMATQAMLSFKDEAFEFCEDIVDAFMDLGNPIAAVTKTIRSIVVELLRALRAGVRAATKAVLDIIPDCCESCCLSACGIDIPALTQEIYDSLCDTVEDFFKDELRERKVPTCITDKIELNDISPDEDIGEPKSRARAKTPEQQTMDGGDDDSDDGNDEE